MLCSRSILASTLRASPRAQVGHVARRAFASEPTGPASPKTEEGPTLKVAARGFSATEAAARAQAFERARLLKKLERGQAGGALPAQILYSSNATGRFHKFNALFSLAAFPVHAWGYFVLPDTTLLAFPLAFSMLWVFYSMKRAETTVTQLELLEGHQQLRIQSFSFFGGIKNTIVDRLKVSPVFVESKETLELPPHLTTAGKQRTPQDMQLLGSLLSEHRIGFLDVLEGKKRVRYSIDYKTLTNVELLPRLSQFARDNSVLVNADQSHLKKKKTSTAASPSL